VPVDQPVRRHEHVLVEDVGVAAGAQAEAVAPGVDHAQARRARLHDRVGRLAARRRVAGRQRDRGDQVAQRGPAGGEDLVAVDPPAAVRRGRGRGRRAAARDAAQLRLGHHAVDQPAVGRERPADRGEQRLGPGALLGRPPDQLNQHAGRERGGAVAARQVLLCQRHRKDVGALAAVLARHDQAQVAGDVQVGVVFGGEAAVAIVPVRALGEARRQVIRQRDHAPLWGCECVWNVHPGSIRMGG